MTRLGRTPLLSPSRRRATKGASGAPLGRLGTGSPARWAWALAGLAGAGCVEGEPAVDPLPAPMSLAAPIAKAQDWLRRGGDPSDPTSLLLVDHLARKFGPIELRELAATAASRLPARLAPFRRLAEAGARAEAEMIDDPRNRFAWPVLTGLHCDQHPLPEDFLARIEALSKAGGYELTHAALGLTLALERGCVSSAPDLLHTQNIALAIIVERLVVDDLALEAAALLLHRDRHRLVADAFIEKVAAHQRADGRWSFGEHGDLHATVLALWVLLERGHPAAAARPLAPNL